MDEDRYRRISVVRPGEKVKLKDWPTKVKPIYGSKEEYKEVAGEACARN
jgi:hypothetical protein